MKFMMNDRIKHRLTGVVVILSIGIICLPAMMKQSNHHFEDNFRVSLKLPAKPVEPKVVIPKQTAMLKSVKVAHVDIAHVAPVSHPSPIAKAQSLSQQPKSVLVKVDVPLTSVIAKAEISSKPVVTANAGVQKGYGIQLASFTQESNAESLVARLRKEGYDAKYMVFKGKQGQFYQVVAGMSRKKDDVLSLQKKIATNMQLTGYIIPTGVS